MTNDLKISLFDMVSCISSVVDMVNPLIVDHHKQVAYIALCIAKELKLKKVFISGLFYALL